VVGNILTTGQCAKLCGVTARDVAKWFDTGRLRGYRIPGSQDRRVPKEYLLRFLREQGMPIPDGLTEPEDDSNKEIEKQVGPTVDDVLKSLRGDPENFRQILTDKDTLLQKLCRYAKRKGEDQNVPAWSIIGEVLGHGSGVSSAIYELYREYK